MIPLFQLNIALPLVW